MTESKNATVKRPPGQAIYSVRQFFCISLQKNSPVKLAIVSSKLVILFYIERCNQYIVIFLSDFS